MKKNKTYILLAILVVGAIMVYFLTRKVKKSNIEVIDPNDPVIDNGSVIDNSAIVTGVMGGETPVMSDPIQVVHDPVVTQQNMNTQAAVIQNPISRNKADSNGCISPTFNSRSQYSGRSCAGELINENIVLKLGDEGCEVLLLQQRLNSIETERDILSPTGKFCCATQSKLMRLMSLPRFALNQFSPDEQIGFNELEAGKKLTPYSYMDTKTFNK